MIILVPKPKSAAEEAKKEKRLKRLLERMRLNAIRRKAHDWNNGQSGK